MVLLDSLAYLVLVQDSYSVLGLALAPVAEMASHQEVGKACLAFARWVGTVGMEACLYLQELQKLVSHGGLKSTQAHYQGSLAGWSDFIRNTYVDIQVVVRLAALPVRAY